MAVKFSSFAFDSVFSVFFFDDPALLSVFCISLTSFDKKNGECVWPVIKYRFPFFFFGGPGYHSSRSFQAVWDCGHVLFFAIATTWIVSLLRRAAGHLTLHHTFFSVFAGVLVCGVMVEILQMFTGGRSPDLLDVLRNQLGCLAAFAWWIRPNPFTGHLRLGRFFRGTVVLLIVIAICPLAQAVIDEQLAIRQFPVLADFETPFERYRWINPRQMHEEETIVRHGRKAMRVHLSTAQYSGVSLFYFPENWQAYRSLQCSVFNPRTTKLELSLRIHDTQHKLHGSEYADRFNKQVVLQPGWNDLVIDLDQVRNAPKGRSMDMQHIEGFGLFVVQQAQPMEIIIDHEVLAP